MNSILSAGKRVSLFTKIVSVEHPPQFEKGNIQMNMEIKSMFMFFYIFLRF